MPTTTRSLRSPRPKVAYVNLTGQAKKTWQGAKPHMLLELDKKNRITDVCLSSLSLACTKDRNGCEASVRLFQSKEPLEPRWKDWTAKDTLVAAWPAPTLERRQPCQCIPMLMYHDATIKLNQAGETSDFVARRAEGWSLPDAWIGPLLVFKEFILTSLGIQKDWPMRASSLEQRRSSGHKVFLTSHVFEEQCSSQYLYNSIHFFFTLGHWVYPIPCNSGWWGLVKAFL